MNKKIIYEEVLKLDGGVRNKGFEYLVQGIEEVYNNPNIGTIELYYKLADMNNDDRYKVERAIRYYIEMIFKKGNKQEIDKFNMKLNRNGIPIPTEFLKAFAVYLKINY